MKRIVDNWENLFKYFQTDEYKNCIDMKEKFIGIIVSETKKIIKQ